MNISLEKSNSTKIDHYYYGLTKEYKQTKKQIILNCIKNNGAIQNRVISDLTGIPINVVTARCNELKNEGKIELAGKTFDQQTKTTVNIYKAL